MGGNKDVLAEIEANIKENNFAIEQEEAMAAAEDAWIARGSPIEETETTYVKAKAEAAEAKIRVESLIYEMNTVVSNPEKLNLGILEAKLRLQNTETLIEFGRHYYERAKWLEGIAQKYEARLREIKARVLKKEGGFIGK